MQTEATLNWTLEMVHRTTDEGGRFSSRVLSARHTTTGEQITLVLDRFACVERITSGKGCPQELIDELVAMFPDCMECEYV